MFTAVRQGDGTLRFETHVPPSELSPAEAREALEALDALLEALRDRARADPTAGALPVHGPAPLALPRGEPARGREPAAASG